jgi:hypothetical protein
MRVVSRRLLIWIATAFVAAALGGGRVIHALDGPDGPSGDPADFMTTIVGYIVADDYASAWDSLYPAHKLVALQKEYVDCELQRPVASKLGSIDVLRVRDRKLHVPGDTGRVDAKAVTLRVDLLNSIGAKETFRHTFNVVPVGAHWTWVLTPSRYALYRADGCGT